MLKRSSRTIIVIPLLLAVSGCRQAFDQVTPTPSGSVRNSVGMQLRVAEENTQPTLRIVLPGHPTSDRAIGAKAVDIGRPYLWGLGAFGPAGVDRVLEILQAELKLAMGNCGTQKVSDINRTYAATADSKLQNKRGAT